VDRLREFNGRSAGPLDDEVKNNVLFDRHVGSPLIDATYADLIGPR
jgi:hypothetical protein